MMFPFPQALRSTVSAKAMHTGGVHLENENFKLDPPPPAKRQPSTSSSKRQSSMYTTTNLSNRNMFATPWWVDT